MAAQVEFYYDHVSPTAYLAWTQLTKLCAKYDAALVYHPVLLGGIFKATGNQTPLTVTAKRTWMFADMARYSADYGVPFNLNPNFPVNSIHMMRGAIWAKSVNGFEAFTNTMFEGMWVDGKDMGDVEVLAELVGKAGLDGAAFKDAVQHAVFKQALIAETDEAVTRGVFGVPTMIVDDETHFGQDRLDWVEKALARLT